MGSSLSRALGESVRALVAAQVELDGRAADITRWDREGLPPVALAFTESRLVVEAPVVARAATTTNDVVALVPVSRTLAGRTGPGTAAATTVIGITIRLSPHDSFDSGKERHDRAVDADRAGTAGQ